MTPQLRFPEFTDEWQVKKLGDLADGKLSNGVFNDPSKVGSGYRLINVKDMYVDGLIDTETLTKVAISKVEFDRSAVRDGDLFFTRSSLVKEGIAYTNIYKGIENDITFDGHLIKLTPNVNITSSDFLYYLTKTNTVRRQLITYGTTTTMTTIGQREVANVDVAIPTKPEQQKNADYMRGIDGKLTSIQTKVAALYEYKKGIMQALFSGKLRFKDENGNLYPDWEEKKLGEVLEFVRNGLSIDQNTRGVGYAVTRIETISNNNIDTNRVGFVDTQTDISDYKLLLGDLLFSNINSPAQIGRTVYIDKNLDVYHGMNLLRLRVQRDKVNAKYIYYVLSSSKYKRHFERICNKAVNQASINQTDLKRTITVIPSIQEQQKIANFLTILDDKIKLEEAKLASAKEFKKGLLQRMFL